MTHAPDAFLKAYRDAFQQRDAHWGGPTLGAGRTAPDLDALYLPLRLGAGYDVADLDRGAVLSPEDVPALKQPLLVRGPAGCGKTTWLRHTFRTLLRLPDCLPLMLDLHQPTTADCAPEAGPFAPLAFLARAVLPPTQRDRGSDRPHRLFSDPSGPVPVLLVDGWDTLRDPGRDLRAGLRRLVGTYPRLRVVGTSRPFAAPLPPTFERYTEADLPYLTDMPPEWVLDGDPATQRRPRREVPDGGS